MCILLFLLQLAKIAKYFGFMQEVKSSSTLFLLAGYETTGNALAFFTQQISRHPRIQQKLREEINRTFADEVFEISDKPIRILYLVEYDQYICPLSWKNCV